MTSRSPVSYEFGPFRLCASERLLLRDGQPVPLPPKVFDTLLTLIENSGRLLEKDALMTRLWPDTFVEEPTLARNISGLRKALGESTTEQKFIETVPKRGYRFTGDVKCNRLEEATVILNRHISSRLVLEEHLDADAGVTSIAVLPFRPITAEGRDEYLELGIADALITRLSNVSQIVVRPTRSVRKDIGAEEEPAQAGRDLRVGDVLD